MEWKFAIHSIVDAASAARRNDMSIFEIFRKREITEEIFARHYIHPVKARVRLHADGTASCYWWNPVYPIGLGRITWNDMMKFLETRR